jgi:CheY-like chemotaxis protein
MENCREYSILLVEDNPGHARLIEKNLRRADVTNPIMIARDGQEALDLIFEEGKHEGEKRPSPLFILLDLNLPGKSGCEVLQRIKSDECTKHIPVAVVTSTDDSADVKTCYELGCSIFLTKPVDPMRFSDVIRMVARLLSAIRIPESS